MSTTIFSQRKLDFSVNMTSPTASSTIRTGQSFSVSLTVTNNGPDVIKTTDTLVYLLGVGTTVFTQTATLVPITANISNGGTANFTVNNLQISGGNGGAMNLCSYLVLYNRALPDSVKDNAIGGNNSSCVSLKYSGTGIGQVAVNKFMSTSYPNPVNSVLNVNFNSFKNAQTFIEIYDMQGRLIQSVDKGIMEAGSQTVVIDVNALSKGVYFYKVVNGTDVSTNKFVIE